MKIEQLHWLQSNGWEQKNNLDLKESANLVLAFGGRKILEDEQRFKELKQQYPHAHIVMGSTSGEIIGNQVFDDSISATAIQLEHTALNIAYIDSASFANSFKAGQTLAEQLNADDLKYVFLLSDGQLVNGSELIKGVNESLAETIISTGGLAGDGAAFSKTLVSYNEAPKSGKIVAIGFYGDRLKVGHGSKGGWDSFGLERTITKSKGNVLYELDGQNALELYKKYLGEKANELPGAALLFPLSINLGDSNKFVVRTILSIDEENQGMVFAGDIPEGQKARLMRANFDRLVDGAANAAQASLEVLESFEPELAILISCVGRKLVLKHRIEEEVEEVEETFPNQPIITGFYSYGELSPFNPSAKCELHNQTMTITALAEV